MNKAFLIILVPAVIVALAWITVGWGLRASVPVGIAILVAGLTAAASLLRRRRRDSRASR